MRKVLIGATALALASCGSEASQEVAFEDGSVSVDEKSGETTVKIDTPDGTATMRSGADLPVELPHGLKLYPGATVTSNSQVDHAANENRVVLLSFETDDSPEDVAKFYREAAKANAIELSVDSTINGGVMLIGEAPGGAVFSLTVQAEEGKTNGALMTGL